MPIAKFHTDLALVLLLATLGVQGVGAAPPWLVPGSYVTYIFDKAYLASGWETGQGTYEWRCIAVNGTLATLNVSLRTRVTYWEKVEGQAVAHTFDIDNSTIVFINTSTRALLDERGRVWGYAHFWMDLAREAPRGEEEPPRNMTLVLRYFNMTIDEVHVSRTKYTSQGKDPLETPFGKFDDVITIWAFMPGPLVIPNFSMGGKIFQFIYELKFGLLVGGTYMDDILRNVFSIATLYETKPVSGRPPIELQLAKTNMELGVYQERGNVLVDIIAFVRTNALLITATLFVLPLLALLLRGRTHGR